MILETVIIVLGVVGVGLVLSGIRFVRPDERGIIERWGKYSRYAKPGFNYITPIAESLIRVNITEMMITAEPQEIITKDRLNARVDAQIYFKVKPDEVSIKATQYNVYNYKFLITNLARTTLRNIIGTLSLKEANSERDTINESLMKVVKKETNDWGIEVVRTELAEIDPPKDVQETMNKVVKAENEKQAALDYALARQTQADGERMAAIKVAEGSKQAAILNAEGQAKAFDLINKSFIGNAQILRKLETTERALANNSKIVVPTNTQLINVIGDMAGVTPLPLTKRQQPAV